MSLHQASAIMRRCLVADGRFPAIAPRPFTNHTRARVERRQAQLTIPFTTRPAVVCLSSAAPSPSNPKEATGRFISRTEVPPFIQRDDMIDQLHHWAIIEAGDGGFRNFGFPMTVDPVYNKNGVLWGFHVGIFKDGVKLTTISVGFDDDTIDKSEWVGRNEEGFPTMEGKVESVEGRNIEIWKLDQIPVTEDLRSAIRGFCQGLMGSVNRYYAFGSVFVDDERG